MPGRTSQQTGYCSHVVGAVRGISGEFRHCQPLGINIRMPSNRCAQRDGLEFARKFSVGNRFPELVASHLLST